MFGPEFSKNPQETIGQLRHGNFNLLLRSVTSISSFDIGLKWVTVTIDIKIKCELYPVNKEIKIMFYFDEKRLAKSP